MLKINFLDKSTLRNVFQTDQNLTIGIIRDDLYHPFVSGNKFRKLKGFLRLTKEKRIKEKGITKWVTFGGAWSNHLVAVAYTAAKLRISARAFVRGEEVRNPILFLCKQWGMQLEFISRSDYQNLTQKVYKDAVIDGDTLWIPEGGKGKLGFEGFADLIQQIPTDVHYLFTAVGSGTTLAGLCNYNHPVQRIGIVVLKATQIFDEYKNMVLHQPLLSWDYHLGGYAKTNSEYLSFLTKFSQNTGILLDPIYTGKMVYAVYHLIQNSFFYENQKIYLLHTGGLTGILGKWEEYP